ncbi:succinate dehydrogenase assembly factor 1, mitochondrial [Apium graveolens]|uniref:succinate dehydrogenase assembly factor 1, mitochondrial n=1 Tax=Apium graveolens TaxID=4045 RepID=UPI003D7918EA
MGATSRPKLSGLQKQVLALYREFLRAARAKSTEDRKQIEFIVSKQFRHNATQVDRKNFLYIEHLLRRGKHQLDQLKNPATVGLSSLNVKVSDSKHN